MAARKPAISSGSAPELHLPGSPFDRRVHSGVASRDSGEGTAAGGATPRSGTDAAAPAQDAAWPFSVDTLDTSSPVTRVRDHVAAFSESDSDGEAGDAKLATFPAAMARLQEARSRAPRAPKSTASHVMSRTPSAALGRGAGRGVPASRRSARGRADSSDVEGLGLHRSGSLQSRAQLKAADSHNSSPSSSSGLAPRSLHAASRSHRKIALFSRAFVALARGSRGGSALWPCGLVCACVCVCVCVCVFMCAESVLAAQTAKPSTVDYYGTTRRPRLCCSRVPSQRRPPQCPACAHGTPRPESCSRGSSTRDRGARLACACEPTCRC